MSIVSRTGGVRRSRLFAPRKEPAAFNFSALAGRARQIIPIEPRAVGKPTADCGRHLSELMNHSGSANASTTSTGDSRGGVGGRGRCRAAVAQACRHGVAAVAFSCAQVAKEPGAATVGLTR